MANTVAYGFVGMEHLFAERVTAQNRQPILDAVIASASYYANQLDAMFGDANLVRRTTDYSARYALASGGTMQPLDEWGNPLPTRVEGYYDLGWPIQGGGDAYGTNRVSRAHATVGDVNRWTLEAARKYADWHRRHMLGAYFDNTTWSYTDRQYGAITVQPLANGDTVTYPRRSGSVATDDHYLAQASAIDNSNNPFDTIYDELAEHPNNSGPFVAYVATDLVASIEALATFVPVGDPDILLGSGSDRVAGSVAAGVGDMVLGKTDNIWIIEWGALPSTYILAHARGGDPPVAMRQYAAPELQGMFTEMHSPDGNLQEVRFLTYAGYGALNRVGALVYRIGNASYAIPAGYTTPLPV